MHFFEKNGKLLFCILSFLLLLLMPMISKDYGQTGDEDVEILYGIDIYNYYANGDKQVLDYSNKGPHQQGQQFYGGFFNVISEVTQRAFSSFHIVDIRHFYGAITGALLMIFTGLFVYHISGKKWIWGILALLFMVFSPRIFGESMNNGKDIPFAFGFMLAIYFFVRLIDNYKHKIKWIDCIGITLGIIVSIGSRSANAMLLYMYLFVFAFLKLLFDKGFRIWALNFKQKTTQKFYLFLFATFILGYFGGLLFWPFGLEGPVSNLLASIEEMKHRATAIRMLYDGQMISNQEAPSGYLPTWIMISSPIIVIVAYFLYYPTLLLSKTPKSLNLYLIFASTFPILFIIYNKSTIYDSWRHVFFVYPFIVAAAVLALKAIADISSKKNLTVAMFGLGLVGLIPSIIWTVKEHPNQYLYFNEAFGGVKNALGYYEVDYYGHSGKASAHWIIDQEKDKNHAQKVKVRANLEGLDYYFKKDTAWVDYDGEYVRWYERGNKDWDYYISYTRFVPEQQLQNGKWPPKNSSYLVEVDGIPVGFVIKRLSKNDMLAFQALEKQQFDEAIALYEAHLKVDNSDEYVLLNYAYALLNSNQPDKLIKAKASLEQAVVLNASLKNAYDMLSYIYYTEGDQSKAQFYKNKANAQ